MGSASKLFLKSHFWLKPYPFGCSTPLCSSLVFPLTCHFPLKIVAKMQVAVFSSVKICGTIYSTDYSTGVGSTKHFIKQHHKYAPPFGLRQNTPHPVEVMSLGVGTVGSQFSCILGPRLTHNGDFQNYICSPLHAGLFWDCFKLWILTRDMISLGPMNRFLPFWAGAAHHDKHHHYFIGNYASSFYMV